MGFMDGLGNFLGDVTGWNQSQAGAQEQQQSSDAINSGVDTLQAGATTAANEAGYAQGREKSLDTQTDAANASVRSSIGANAGDEMKKAQEAATKQAGEEAAGAGQQATEAALTGARTAGMNKGEAALQAGNSGAQAATNTFGQAVNQGEQQYQNAAGQQQEAANSLASQGAEAASRGLTATGQQVQAGAAQGNIGTAEQKNASDTQNSANTSVGNGLIGAGLGEIGLEEGGEFTVPDVTGPGTPTATTEPGRSNPSNPISGGVQQAAQNQGGSDSALEQGAASVGQGSGGLVTQLSKLFGGGGAAAGGGVEAGIGDLASLAALAKNGMDSVVPPGYPHDTMPIMVSSGEHVKVTPANQVSQSQKSKAQPDLKSALAKIKKGQPLQGKGPVTQQDVNAMAAGKSATPTMKENPMVDLIVEMAKRIK